MTEVTSLRTANNYENKRKKVNIKTLWRTETIIICVLLCFVYYALAATDRMFTGAPAWNYSIMTANAIYISVCILSGFIFAYTERNIDITTLAWFLTNMITGTLMLANIALKTLYTVYPGGIPLGFSPAYAATVIVYGLSAMRLTCELFFRLDRSTDWPKRRRFTAFMPAFDGEGREMLVFLDIPAEAKRVPARSRRELRTDMAIVKEFRGKHGTPLPHGVDIEKAYFFCCGKIHVARKGETLKAGNLNKKWWEKYGEGIPCIQLSRHYGPGNRLCGWMPINRKDLPIL